MVKPPQNILAPHKKHLGNHPQNYST